jgi:hypothetical protein
MNDQIIIVSNFTGGSVATAGELLSSTNKYLNKRVSNV